MCWLERYHFCINVVDKAAKLRAERNMTTNDMIPIDVQGGGKGASAGMNGLQKS